MKKLFLVPFVALATIFATAQDTGFKAGIHLGFPVGDASDFSSFNFGIDGSYLWKVAPKFKAGVSTGYTHYIGKSHTYDFGYLGTYKSKAEDFGFIPVAGTAEYNFTSNIFGAVDLGYAISTKSGIDGGFYWQPKVGYDAQLFQLFAFYKGISSNSTVSSIGIGGAYKF